MTKERKTVEEYLFLVDSTPELATARSCLGKYYVPHESVLTAMILVLSKMKEDGYTREEVLPTSKSVGAKIVNHFTPPLRALKSKWKNKAPAVLEMLQVGRMGDLSLAIAQVYGSGFSESEIQNISKATQEAEINRLEMDRKAKEEAELKRIELLKPENLLKQIAEQEEDDDSIYKQPQVLDVDGLDTSLLDDIE